MKDFSTMKDAVQFRITESEDNYWVEDYWKKAIMVFTSDISETMAFILNDCSDEEFYWISEIFEEIAEKTQCKEFIQVLRDRLAKVLPETFQQLNFKSEHMRKWIDYNEYVRQVKQEIEYAEGRIDSGEN